MKASAACAAVVMLGAGLAVADVRPGAFGVGVLRRDGIIIPFAAFDGKQWVDNWPPPSVDLDVPISLRDVPQKWWGPTPALATWEAWTADGRHSLRVVQPDWVDVHCTRQIGLRSDYQPRLPSPPRSEQPYPKDGLVVSPPQPVEPIAILPPDAAEVRDLIPSVTLAFNSGERRTEARFGHPISRQAREGRVPDIDAVYASGDHPRVYYVEAIRRYRLLGQTADECEVVAFASAWFARDGHDIRELLTTVDLLPCNQAGAAYMLPLGVMRAGGKRYWLAQFSGSNHERYSVAEVQSKTVTGVINAWGGSCAE